MKTTSSSNLIFTILIGSTARRSEDITSDVDIVRIGHRDLVKIAPKRLLETTQVSFVDYDAQKFSQLYEEGSLFIYHIFREGRLLRGDRKTWSALKNNFCVRISFRREIEENRALLDWLQTGTQYDGAFVPYLAHMCRALKNLAIFSLAEERNYIFDKRQALQKAFPQLQDEAISLLIGANNAFERPNVPTQDLRTLDVDTLLRVRSQVAQAIGSPKSHATP